MAQENPAPGGITQKDFVETPYEDASWEVVGEVADTGEFEPMEIESIEAGPSLITDPMFADYGGFPSPGAGKRWHLPEHLSATKKEKRQEAAPEEETIAMTQAQIDALKSQAYAQGKNDGASEAERISAQKVAQLEARLGATLSDMASQVKESSAVTEREAIDLALAISKKIVGFAVEINPEYIIPVVNEALSLAGGAAIRKVRVSPEDMEFIEIVGIGKHLKAFDGTWQFEKDESIRSGCVVETSAGQVDFQLDAAWERIKDNVVKSLA